MLQRFQFYYMMRNIEIQTVQFALFNFVSNQTRIILKHNVTNQQLRSNESGISESMSKFHIIWLEMVTGLFIYIKSVIKHYEAFKWIQKQNRRFSYYVEGGVLYIKNGFKLGPTSWCESPNPNNRLKHPRVGSGQDLSHIMNDEYRFKQYEAFWVIQKQNHKGQIWRWN